MATAVHNNARNATTGFSLNTLLLGWEPPLSPDQTTPTSNQKAEDYVTKFQKNRLMAILALNKAASAHAPLSSKYSQGQCVWLEGKNPYIPRNGQTIPQTLWPLHHYETHLPSSFQTRPPRVLEHSSRLP
jgi:hypothetical protein